MKMLVLDTKRMEFSIAEYLPEARFSCYYDIGMVEAGEGMPGMFVFSRDTEITCIVRQNNGGSSSWWQLEKKISMEYSYCYLAGSIGRELFLTLNGSSSTDTGLFSLNSKTFQPKRVCAIMLFLWAYNNFPPLLSTPTVSTGNLSVASLLFFSLHSYHTGCLMVDSSLLSIILVYRVWQW